MLTWKNFITSGLLMMISFIIDSVAIGICISPENPISVELQYQHSKFTMHNAPHGIPSYLILSDLVLSVQHALSLCNFFPCPYSSTSISFTLLHHLSSFPSFSLPHILGTTFSFVLILSLCVCVLWHILWPVLVQLFPLSSSFLFH